MPTQENQGPSMPKNLPQAMEDRTRGEVEKQVRVDMRGNGSTEAVDQEITYRMGGETEAIRALNEGELAAAWKFKMSAGEYQKGKR